MGIYLNPGNDNFRDMTKADIYVDKTMMLAVTPGNSSRLLKLPVRPVTVTS